MLTRVRNVLARMRSAAAPAVHAAPPEPWPSFDDEVAASGRATLEWVRQRRASRSLYIDIDGERLASAADRHPDIAAATIAAADRVLRHEFDLLGSGPFIPRDPERATGSGYQAIDWRLDPIRDVRFPGGFPHRSWNPDTMRPANADIKLPWELGRCQHFAALGQAYRLTGAVRYAREIIDETRDFTCANPPGVGVQWTCTMDAGLRAVSWTLGLALISACDAIAESEWLDAYRALFDHGVFIERNLENTYEVTSNHFLSNVLGLHFLGFALDGLRSAARWQRQCREWLEQEMRAQVLEDGADYESSIPYHRLVAELFLGAARLAAWNGQPMSEPYTARLRQMIDYLAAVQRPDGLMPVVGDADDGRLHILSEYGRWNPQDGRHLLAPAGAFFDAPGWTALAGDTHQWEAAWWGFGVRAGLSAADVPDARVRHFPSAGITVLRTSDAYTLITNGRVGTNGFGNHKHNDQLAFEYHVRGLPVVVDAGSYVYTPDPVSRNLFRSTVSHSTLSVDGVEQNEMRPDWLFRVFETSHAEHVAVDECEDALEYTGRHAGYRRLPDPVTHTRRFRLRRRTLTITDVLDVTGTHTIRWHFHFAHGVGVAPAGNGVFDVQVGSVALRFASPGRLSFTMAPAWQSPSYGVRVPCLALDFETTVLPGDSQTYVFSFV